MHPDPQPFPQSTSDVPKRRRWPWIAAIPLGFFIGLAAGLSDSGEPTDAAATEPPGTTVTKTVTNEVAKMPTSCQKALDAAGDHISGLENLLEIKIEFINKIMNQDYDIDQLSSRQDEQIEANDTTVTRYAASLITCEDE